MSLCRAGPRVVLKAHDGHGRNLPGTPLHHQIMLQAEKMARQEGMTKEAFLDKEMERIEKEVKELAMKGKVMNSITEEQYDQYIALQKGKKGIYRTLKQLYNATLGWFTEPFDLSESADM